MATLTTSALRERIASGDPGALCLLLGDDDHEKRSLVDALVGSIDEGVRPFNVDRLDGGEVGADAVLAAARIVPVMAQRRVVVAVRAERMLQPPRESGASRRALEALEAYLESPSPETTLVFCASGLDDRRRIVKRLRARAAVVDCGVPADARGASRWIRARLQEAGRQADPAAVRLLGEQAGHGAAHLRNTLERLLLFAGAGDRITAAHVREVAGSSTTGAADDWAVARAIEQGAADAALRELGRTLDGGAVPYMVLGQLAWVVRTRLAAGRVARAMEAVFRTDLALKQSGGEARVLLERLVVDLCGTAAAARRR